MKQAIKPPFTDKTARAKVKAAEDAWNSRDLEVVNETKHKGGVIMKSLKQSPKLLLKNTINSFQKRRNEQ